MLGTMIAVAFLVPLGRILPLRISLTDSAAPAGIYRIVPGVFVERGELVGVCLPSSIAQEGLARGYLSKGDCPGGAEPVAKVIGAVPGDVLKVLPSSVSVDGKTFPDSTVAARDSIGRPLPHVPWGTRRVPPGQVWLFGFNNRRSWDARYFGPVSLSGIRGVLKPILTWWIMAANGHSHEQGLRVHHLANLGGLIALAGLDREPPDFLLGALISVAQESANLGAAQRAKVASAGRKQLEERATSKRAWKSWSRARELHSVTLSTGQVKEIIEALGAHAPENSVQLIVSLRALLTESSHEAS
jgi:conjugative transfer signal peptidase TraF